MLYILKQLFASVSVNSGGWIFTSPLACSSVTLATNTKIVYKVSLFGWDVVFQRCIESEKRLPVITLVTVTAEFIVWNAVAQSSYTA